MDLWHGRFYDNKIVVNNGVVKPMDQDGVQGLQAVCQEVKHLR